MRRTQPLRIDGVAAGSLEDLTGTVHVVVDEVLTQEASSARLREPDVIQLNFFLPDGTENYYVVLKADGTPVDVVAQVEEGEAIPAPAAIILSPLPDQKRIVAYDVHAKKLDQFRVP